MNAFIGSTVQCRRIAGQLTHGEFSSVQVNIACVVMFMFPLVCPVQALLSTGVRSEPRENARGGAEERENLYLPLAWLVRLSRDFSAAPQKGCYVQLHGSLNNVMWTTATNLKKQISIANTCSIATILDKINGKFRAGVHGSEMKDPTPTRPK